MENALQEIAEQSQQLHQAGAALARAGAAFREAHGSSAVALSSVQAHALARHSAWLARYAVARLQRDAKGVEDALPSLARHAAVLDRVRPLAKAARPALDALLQRAARARAEQAGGAAVSRPRARPDPGNMVLDGEDDLRDAGAADVTSEPEAADEPDEEAIYRPPKIAEVVYDGEREAIEEREARVRAKMAARVARNRSVKEMLAEVSGRPEEVRDDDADEDAFVGKEVSRLRRVEEERTRYEEENLTRLNVTREDKKRRRILATVAERSGAAEDTTGDAFADLMGVADRVIGKGAQSSASRRDGQERVIALDAMDRELASGVPGSKREKKRSVSGGGKKKRRRR